MGGSNSCCSSPSDGLAQFVDSVPSDGKAVIKVVGAKGVRPTLFQSSSTNECWCVVSIGGQEKFRTTVVRNMLEPVWQEETQISGFYSNTVLEISIHDNETCLGKAALAWCRGFNGEVDLQDSGDAAVLRLKVRHPTDIVYPIGPPSEFKFRAQRATTDTKWGMRLDTQNNSRLLVDKVEEIGPIATSNDEVLPEHRVKKHDVIVGVNDTSGESTVMMKEFMNNVDITVTVRRGVELFLVLERASENTSLGVAFLPKPKGNSLVVTKLLPGLVYDYNTGEKDESMQVQIGDRVLAVNGEESSAEGLITTLSNITGTFTLTVHKIAPASSEELAGGKAYWYYGD